MRRIRYLATALADFEDIYLYLRREGSSVEAARSFVGRLRRQCSKIASLPGHMGRARPELGEGIRSYALGNYVIFFRYDGPVLAVVNVIEGHRDIEAQFSSPREPR